VRTYIVASARYLHGLWRLFSEHDHGIQERRRRSAFMLLCSILCFVGNIVTIISYHGRPARWIIPFWQPAYPLHLQIFISPYNGRHLYTHVYFSHGK